MLKNIKRLAVSLLTLGLFTTAQAAELNKHHFWIQMLNASDKNVTVSFHKGVGNVSLAPELPDNTPLKPSSITAHYAVNIEPLDPAATFNITFKNEKECNFTVGFYAPGRPRILMEGLGCIGGGTQIVEGGKTLMLYISDINLKK